jgi:hypothetical protein
MIIQSAKVVAPEELGPCRPNLCAKCRLPRASAVLQWRHTRGCVCHPCLSWSLWPKETREDEDVYVTVGDLVTVVVTAGEDAV